MKTNLLKSICLVLTFCCAQAVMAQRFLTEQFTDAQIVVQNDVKYAENFEFLTDPTNGVLVDLKMRIFQPDPNIDQVQERPLVIYIHTGNMLPSCTNGSPNGEINDSSVVEICRQYAKRGYVAAAIDYRRGWNPLSQDAEVRKSTLLRAVYRAVQDVRSAIRFFRMSAADQNNPFGIDPNRIVVFGEGTGGYIALASATLDTFPKLLIPSLLDQSQNPPGPLVDTLVSGNLFGIGGTRNISNHPNFSSDFNMSINIGGALADTLWMEAGQPAMVSIQAVRDPFAPYGPGTVIVPTTNENVVDVFGAGTFMRKAAELGNNCAFSNPNDFTDPYSVAARSRYNQTIPYIFGPPNDQINIGSGEGLFPIILPLASTLLFNQSSPWQWWNTTQCNSASSLESNPDMSKAKALLYIDTIMGYTTPRMFAVLNLSDLSAAPNRCNEIVSVFNSFKEKESLNIYPNPSLGNIQIDLTGTDFFISKVKMMDVAGRVVYETTVSDFSKNIKISSQLETGLYFVNVQLSNGQQAVRKVIVQ